MVFVIFRFYLLLQDMRKAVPTKMGPNDALRCVVWAISTCFFEIFMFMYTNHFFTIIFRHEVGQVWQG